MVQRSRSPSSGPTRRPRPSRVGLAGMLVALALAAGLLWWWHQRGAEAATGYRTETVDRGAIRVAISATGTLAATSTVDVGSQISGQVTQVLVDFNDRVATGQVLARIDPSTYQAQISQGAAAIASARANLASAQATLRNLEADYARKAALAGDQLVARSDADLARSARDQARAQVEAARAQIEQQLAATRTSRLNLERTVIRSPVDGVVLTRSIEPGQTVAASLQAPVLFQIAEDLAQMEIVLAIDEADIGQVKPGQAVAFTVDAFPDRQYRGEVRQVRLSATNTNNVITYPVVVAVDNRDQSLLPGMTANAEIEVSRRDDVLRVPNAALRYRPDEDAGAGTPPAAEAARRGGALADGLVQVARGLDLDPAQQATFDAALEALRARAAARQAPATPSGGGSALFGGRGGPRGGGGNGEGPDQGALRQRMLQRLQQQFGPFRASLDPARQQRWDQALTTLATARRAPVYRLVDGTAQAVIVQVGASDGSHTEVAGDIHAGDPVIVGVARAPAR